MRALAIAMVLCLVAGFILFTISKTSTLFASINSRFAIDNVLSDDLIPEKTVLENENKRWLGLASLTARLLKSRSISMSKEVSTAVIEKRVTNNAISSIKDGTTRAAKSNRSILVAAYAATREAEAGSNKYDGVLLLNKAKQLKNFAQEKGYSTQYGFIVNMGMKSGKKRFFVVDLATMTIVNKGIVAHGRGDERITLDKKYSNEKGSNCTALGIYKVGKYYMGTFGPSYRLYGLQNSNNNAFDRAIVLHAMR